MPSLQIIQQFQKEIGVERARFMQALEDTRGSQNANITAFYRQLLDELVEELQAGDVDPSEAEQWMRNELRQAVQNNEIADLMMDQMEDDFNRVSDYLDQRFDLLDRNYNIGEARILARQRMNDYALTAERTISNRLAVEIGALSQVYSRDELYDMMEDKLQLTGHRVGTVTDNIIRGYNTEVTDNLAQQTGLTLWRYEGTIIENSRLMCRHLLRLGNCYTKAQIMQMDNGHGLNPFTFRGGYHCRHIWAPGEEGWPGFERPYPAGAAFITLNAEAGNTQITVPQAPWAETAEIVEE